MKIKKKNLKPIDIDASLKYRCPETDCGRDHWLSLKETQTKNFKVVCYCGNIFKPQRIKNIKIFYVQKQENKQQLSMDDIKNVDPQSENKIQSLTPTISDRLISLCSKTFMDYGFTKKEAEELLRQSYILYPTENALELINYTLKMIGHIDDTNYSTK
jgi:hypothetical protein